MNNNKNINKSMKKYILAIIDYLSMYCNAWENNKVFIDGEMDSNQTKFEYMSNQLEIGVEANCKTVGYSLLYILRMIIDDNFELIYDDLNYSKYEDIFYKKNKGYIYKDAFNGSIQKIAKIINILKEYHNGNIDFIIDLIKQKETMYTKIYEADDNTIISVKLYNWQGEREIKKKKSEIDIWTLERIRLYILSM